MAIVPSAPQLRGELYDIVRTFRMDIDRRNLDLPLSERVAISGNLDALRTIIRSRSSRSRYFTVEELDLLEEEVARLIAATTRSRISDRLIERNIFDADNRTIIGHESHTWLTFAEQLKTLLRDISPEIVELREEKFDFAQGSLPLLSDVVPKPKVSPVHFDFENDRLVLTHVTARSRREDEHNVSRARSTLIESGQKIIEELRRSNCDRRFLEDVIAVQRQLESAEDIIQLGILNLACEEQRKEFEPELPSSLAGSLRAHCSNIAMYVAQFPEWLRYTENATEVELSAADIRYSQEVAEAIATQFEAIPAKVDPEVPRTLRAISEAVANPVTATRRVSFALVRTLENLFIRVFSYAGKFTDEIAAQSLTKAANIGSSAIAISFGTLILGYATNLAAVFEKVPGMAWLKSAVEIFGKLIASSSL
jgi:hypothetical protein